MKFVALALTLLSAICHGETVRPNFIVILSDDQGWGTTSVMIDPAVPESKSDFFKTPNIERMAADGMRFSQAYASHCNCSPSRAALQTGRSPAALHMTDIIERQGGTATPAEKLIVPHIVTGLSKENPTIPELLKAHDPEYRTAHFGKWHIAGGGPAAHGYDVSDGPTTNGQGGRKTNLPDDPKQIFSITRHGIDFMNAQVKEGHPFYLQLSHYATHAPDQSRPATRKSFAEAPKGKRHDNVPYGAMLADMDTGIGQLLDAVKAAGIADHTYIIYTADNGSVPTDDPGNINGPIRGYKASVWEGGIRVPFMVTGPGIAAGAVSRVPVVGYDILPTVCDLAGIKEWPKAIEGGSLKSALAGGDAVKRPEDFLVFHWPHYQHQKHSTPDTTLLQDGWKLHYWWETGETQLFHLDKDLGESKDVASEFPDRAAKMKSVLQDHLKQIKAQEPVTNPNFDPSATAGPSGKGRKKNAPDTDD
jgi:arylsulfatase A